MKVAKGMPDCGMLKLASVGSRDVVVISEDAPELISPGQYSAVGDGHRLLKIFGGVKLAITFIVMVPDPARPSGGRKVALQRFYNVRHRAGRYAAGPSSDYRREWITVANRRPSRGNRLSPSIFTGALVIVEVTTVTTDRNQRDLSPHATYSKIARIVELQAGGGPCR